jgi:16S rRNA (guanine966-N2)-methyltransferase
VARFGSPFHFDAVRVISGRLGGRTLRAPKGRTTRPTSDRVRESLFQILGDLHDFRVADLYAGSGALGIEALSRGACQVVFVEKDRRALDALRENLATLALEGSSLVLSVAVERAESALRGRAPFDLVLADPPWAELAGAVAALSHLAPLLAPDGRLVLEHAARDTPPTLGLPRVDERSWGDTAVSIYRQQAQEKA